MPSVTDEDVGSLENRLEVDVVLDDNVPEITPPRSLDIARGLVRLETFQEMTQHWGWSDQEWIELITGVLTRELLDE